MQGRPAFDDLVRRCGGKPDRTSVKVRCVVHEDASPSLSITLTDDGTVLWHCHAGCDQTAVTDAIRHQWPDLWKPVAPLRPSARPVVTPSSSYRHVCYYTYTDETGKPVHRVERREATDATGTRKKNFPQSHWNGTGWSSGTKPLPTLHLYHLPDIIQWITPSVWYCEGEKDADRLKALGLVATTNAKESETLDRLDATPLRGRRVYILVDNDVAGRKTADHVARKISPFASSVRMVTLPELPEKGDVSDWLDAGTGTVDDLEKLGSTAPEWQPIGDGAAGIAHVERSPATKREPAAVLADSDAASLFVRQAGDDYRWVVDDERWLHWDGTRWNGDVTDTEVRHRAMMVVDQALREYGEATNDGERDRAFVRWLSKCRSRGRLDAMVSLAKGNPAVTVRAADLDRDRNMLVVRNGVVDLQTGQLLPHSRADLYTRIVRHGSGHDGVPAEYRPVAELRVPPAWQAFLDRVQPDPAVRDFLQLVIGAALSGTGSERRIVVMHGPGGTGKGTFMATVMAALGGESSGYVTTGDAEVLMMSKNPGDGSSHLAGVARWRGKRVVWLDETADGRRLDAGKVKRLIPGDGGEVVARDLYERGRDTRAFPATWLPIMTTNHLPIAPADDDAIWDRLVAVPWDTRIPQGERTDVSASLPRDPEVLEYVLSWAVDGAVRWHQARTGKSGSVRQSGVTPPVAVGVATDAWQRRSESASGAGDALTEWLRSDGVVEGDMNESLTDLHASHTAWARSVRTHPMTVRAFTTALRARGMKLVRKSGVNVWNGIGLMSQASHDG
jgi:putative DNA primase/helicase